MARRPPAFVRNLADARHINIAHGLYPREPLSEAALDAIASALRTSIKVSEGRTYAGWADEVRAARNGASSNPGFRNGMTPFPPPVWDDDRLELDRRVAIGLFREERMKEPLVRLGG